MGFTVKLFSMFFTIKYLGNVLLQKVRENIYLYLEEEKMEEKKKEEGLKRMNEFHSCLQGLPCIRKEKA